MLTTRRNIKATIELHTSDLLARIQRLEDEQAAMRSRLESERQVRSLAIQVGGAAQMAVAVGAAVERFAEALRKPLRPPPRGQAGGLARAQRAWRYLDGTFMPESAKREEYLAEYERHAVGGRARAASATRLADGTFATNEHHPQSR